MWIQMGRLRFPDPLGGRLVGGHGIIDPDPPISQPLLLNAPTPMKAFLTKLAMIFAPLPVGEHTNLAAPH